ncbi:hypothetical protein KI387_016922, partial [Taxus chinensis]
MVNPGKIVKEIGSSKDCREERRSGELARNEGSISGRFHAPLAFPLVDKHGQNMCPNPHQGRVSSSAADGGVSGRDDGMTKDGEGVQGCGSFKLGVYFRVVLGKKDGKMVGNQSHLVDLGEEIPSLVVDRLK